MVASIAVERAAHLETFRHPNPEPEHLAVDTCIPRSGCYCFRRFGRRIAYGISAKAKRATMDSTHSDSRYTLTALRGVADHYGRASVPNRSALWFLGQREPMECRAAAFARTAGCRAPR